VKHIFRQYLVHPQAQKAAEASLCAGKQEAEAFWAMHDLLFERMEEWSGEQDAAGRFAQYAIELGLDGDAFAACLESGETAAQVQAQMEQGRAMGVRGTPAFFINDWFISGAQPFEKFQEAIEAALRGEPPPPTPTPPPPPFDTNPERPGYTYGGDVTLGSADAEIILLEFIDFHSADNLEFFLDMWPELGKAYVGPGKVRVVVKHFPAADQPTASKAAEAAECAGQQEAFWAMHDLLFQQQEDWSKAEDVSAVLKEYADQLGLDVGAFSACLDEGQTGDKVQQDIAIAQRNELQPAPQFVVFYEGQGGVVPLEELQKVIDQLLAQ
jgi:protein-disulfide isomerase